MYDKVATLLIFVGAILSTAFGEHKDHTYDVPGLIALFNRTEFYVFQVGTG